MWIKVVHGNPLKSARPGSCRLCSLSWLPAENAQGTWGFSMARLGRSAPDLLLAFLLLAFFGCGGGSSGIQTVIPPPPPPPQPDFSIGFFLKFRQCAARRHELRNNVVREPTQWLHRFRPGHSLPVYLRASFQIRLVPSASAPGLEHRLSFLSGRQNAATGNSTIVATGTSGTLSHPANLALTIQTGIAANLPRTTYAQNRLHSRRRTIPPASLITGTSPTIQLINSFSWPIAR